MNYKKLKKILYLYLLLHFLFRLTAYSLYAAVSVGLQVYITLIINSIEHY